jgi:histidinol-phosphatase
MSRPRTTDLSLALRLAEMAGELALPFFEKGVVARAKHDGSPVTEADFAVEAALIDALAQARPDDGVLSEEGGSRPGVRRRWILDPIDGTVNFAAGDPNWGTHVALEVDSELEVGVVTRPVAGEIWWAVRGGGAFHSRGSSESVAFHVSNTSALDQARVTMWPPVPGPTLDALQQATIWVEPDWSLLRGLLDGELDGIVAVSGGVWDHAPPVLLTREAGGEFTDHDGGQRLDTRGGIYSNGRIHGQLREVVRSTAQRGGRARPPEAG